MTSSDSSRTLHYLQQWHKGEEEGLNILLQQHLPWIQAHVRDRLGPKLRMKVESCDIVQDAALEFLKYGPRFILSDEKKFRALLVRIVENVLRDKHDWFSARRRAIAKEHPLPADTVLFLDAKKDSAQTPSKSAQQHEEEALLRLGIELLKSEHREVLVLHQWDHLSFREIAERLKISEDAAWKRHKTAITLLAKRVGELRSGKLNLLDENDSS